MTHILNALRWPFRKNMLKYFYINTFFENFENLWKKVMIQSTNVQLKGLGISKILGKVI